jgi:ADP-heptose:LPS heptosyltransferase
VLSSEINGGLSVQPNLLHKALRLNIITAFCQGREPVRYQTNCKDFNGYKPCRPGWVCDGCTQYRDQGFRILIINLDALGDVLMTTALLPAIKNRYPNSTIRWITHQSAVPLLENNPHVDEIIPYNMDSISYLRFMEFDLILSCDRDRKSTAVAMSTPALDKRGFGLGPHGAVIPLNESFEYAYRLGLDDELKFKKNRQTGQQILAKGMGFPHLGSEYILELRDEEKMHIAEYRKQCGIEGNIRALGVNTGCSDLFINKKLPLLHTLTVLRNILNDSRSASVKILLLGGKSETELNQEIAQSLGDPRVIQTPTAEGIRRGLHYIAACDACLTGDTFGLHAAIALRVPVIAYFTLSCDVEIDLYGRGEMVLADVPCRPCWKRRCPDPYCLDRIDLNELTASIWRVLPE